MRSSSRSPKRPCSPACGFRPQMTSRGSRPRRRRSAATVRSMTSVIRSMVSRLRHVAVADVRGDERAGDFRGVLHHAGARGVRARGEDFRVAGEADAAEVQRFLVNGRGGDRVDRARERVIDRAGEIRVRRPARGGADHARRQVGERELGEIEDAGAVWNRQTEPARGRLENRRVAVDDRLADRHDRRLRQRAHTELRPDPRGVAHGERDAWQSAHGFRPEDRRRRPPARACLTMIPRTTSAAIPVSARTVSATGWRCANPCTRSPSVISVIGRYGERKWTLRRIASNCGSIAGSATRLLSTSVTARSLPKVVQR